MSFSKLDKQLPEGIAPKYYKIQLRPDLSTNELKGQVCINVEVKREIGSFLINGRHLELTSIVLQNQNLQMNPSSVTMLEENEIDLHFEKKIPKGEYELKIEYTGILNSKPQGLFMLKEPNDKGVKEVVGIGTFFWMKRACKCFPCWNDPRLRTKIELEVLTSGNQCVISSMAIKNTESLGGSSKFCFYPTPMIVVDSLGLIIANFEHVEKNVEDKLKVRVYVSKKRKDEAIFALDLLTQAIPFFEKYFSCGLGISKLDFVAIDSIKEDNVCFGLVMLKSDAILIQSSMPLKNKQNVALAVLHALVKVWLGTMVTMNLYVDIWVWDSIASFLSFYSLEKLMPNWMIWLTFAYKMNRHIILDSFDGTYSLPKKSLNYKSASIFNMLLHYINEDKFQNGFQKYLSKNNMKSTPADELWKKLEDSCKIPISKIMKTWTMQQGLPMLLISLVPKEDYFILRIKQRRLLKDTHHKTKGEIWIIPLTVYHCDKGINKIACFMLDTQGSEIIISCTNITGCIYLHTGYFRTCYSPFMLRKFHRYIETDQLPTMDRLNLLEDTFELVQTGYCSTFDLLELIKCFENEWNISVWREICNILSILNALLLNFSNKVKDNFRMYSYTLFYKMYAKHGWEEKTDESDNDKFVRSLILSHLANLNNTEVINKAIEKFMFYGSHLPESIQYPVYKTVVRTRNLDIFDVFIDLYRSSTSREERIVICKALAASENVEFIKKVFDFAMSADCSTSDGVIIMSYVILSSKVGNIAAWGFMKDNMEQIISKFGISKLVQIINCLEVNITTEEMGFDIEKFFSNLKYPELDVHVNRVAKTAVVRAEWFRRDYNKIAAYFETQFENTDDLV